MLVGVIKIEVGKSELPVIRWMRNVQHVMYNMVTIVNNILLHTWYFPDSERVLTQSCPILCESWTVACLAPLPIGFPKQGYWSELHFLLQGIFQTQDLNPHLSHLLLCRQSLYHCASQEAKISAILQKVCRVLN